MRRVNARRPRGFDDATDGQRLAVDVWSGHGLTPLPRRLAQDFDWDTLRWEGVELPDSTNTTEPHPLAAWWSFDVDDLVPEGAVPDADDAVGVRWSDAQGRTPMTSFLARTTGRIGAAPTTGAGSS